MPARLGLVYHSCGHQTPVPSRGERHVDSPCPACRQPASILDLTNELAATYEPPAAIRRRRSQCQFCRTPIYVAIGTPDEQRTTCRYCLHLGYRPITGAQS